MGWRFSKNLPDRCGGLGAAQRFTDGAFLHFQLAFNPHIDRTADSLAFNRRVDDQASGRRFAVAITLDDRLEHPLDRVAERRPRLVLPYEDEKRLREFNSILRS